MHEWSLGLGFVNEMAEKDGVHKTKGDLYQDASRRSRAYGGCYNRWTSRELHEEVRVGCVERLEEGDRLCEGDWLDESWLHL